VLNLEFVRRKRKMTQAQLATSARVGQWFVSVLECGQALPTPDQAQRLANVLGTSAESLMKEAPDPEPEPEVVK
jgi:transcriptional regulator with XRE-family HTH domain